MNRIWYGCVCMTMELRADAVAEEADALQQRAVGDAGRREDDRLARRQILRPGRPASRSVIPIFAAALLVLRRAGRRAARRSRRSGSAWPPRSARPRARRRCPSPRGRRCPTTRGRDAGREVAVADQPDARAGRADLRDQLLVPRRGRAPSPPGRRRRGRGTSRWPPGCRRPARRGRRRASSSARRPASPCRGRARAAARPRGAAASTAIAFGAPIAHRFVPSSGIDRDVDLRETRVDLVPARRARLGQPELLADVEHRRLVALAFADDDRAVDGHGVELPAHRLDRHVVGLGPVALAHRVRARDGRLLDDPQELERQVGRVIIDSCRRASARPARQRTAAARSASAGPRGSRARSRPASACGPRACPRRSPRPCSCGRSGPTG